MEGKSSCSRKLSFSSDVVSQSRYVVLGTGSMLKTQNDILSSTDNSRTSARKGLKATSSKPSLVDVTQPEPEGRRLYISIYKAKVGNPPSPQSGIFNLTSLG